MMFWKKKKDEGKPKEIVNNETILLHQPFTEIPEQILNYYRGFEYLLHEDDMIWLSSPEPGQLNMVVKCHPRPDLILKDQWNRTPDGGWVLSPCVMGDWRS